MLNYSNAKAPPPSVQLVVVKEKLRQVDDTQ